MESSEHAQTEPHQTQQSAPPNQGQAFVQPGQESLHQPVAYFVDQATGQVYYGVAPQQSQVFNPIQPPNPAQYVLYAAPQGTAGKIPSQQPEQQAPQAEPASAQTQARQSQPDYSQLLKSVEDFAQGDATVSEVLKNLYTQTAQDDQFWKGAIVGAAAAVLLTSESVRQGMGKTFASLFGGSAGANAAAERTETTEKSV